MPKVGDLVIELVVNGKKATATIKQFGQTVEHVGHKVDKSAKHMHDSIQKRLGMSVMDLQMNMFQLMAVSGMLAFSIKKPIDKFAEFDKKIREIGTLLNDFNENTLRRMGDEILDASAKFGQSFDRMAKARYDIISAGFTKAADSARILEVAAKLAVGGVSSIDQTAISLTKVLNSFGVSAQEAERASDILFTTVRLGQTTINELVGSIGQVAPIAKSAGLRMEDLGAAMAVVTAGGLDTTIGTIALRGALRSLAAPVAQAKEAMEAAGIEIKRFEDGTLDLVGTLEQFRGLPLEKIKEFIPDVRAANAVVVLSNNVDKLRAAIQEMENAAGATDVAFGKMAKGISFRIDQMKERFNRAVINMGRTMVPFAEALINVVTAFTNLPQKVQLTTMAFFSMLLPLKLIQIILSSFGIMLGPGGWLLVGLGSLAFLIGLIGSKARDSYQEIREFSLSIQGLETVQLQQKLRELTNELEELQDRTVKLKKGEIKKLSFVELIKAGIDPVTAFQLSLTKTEDIIESNIKRQEILKEKINAVKEQLELLKNVGKGGEGDGTDDDVDADKKATEEMVKNRVRLLELKRQAGLIETEDYKEKLNKQLEIAREKLGEESELYLQLLAQIKLIEKQQTEEKRQSAQKKIKIEMEEQEALLQLRKISTQQYIEFLQKQADAAKEKYGEQSIEYLKLLQKIQEANGQLKSEQDQLWQKTVDDSRLMLSTLDAAYRSFFSTIINQEMTAKERREAIWQSMKFNFVNTLADMLKAFISGKVKEAFFHALTEKTKTTTTKTETAKREAISLSAMAKEIAMLVKSVANWIAQIAAKLFSFFASLGPPGILLGLAAVPAAIAGIKAVIKSVMAFAHGGEINKPVLGLVGEAGPEIIAPKKTFVQVVNTLLQSREIAPLPQPGAGFNSTKMLEKLEGIEKALSRLKLVAQIDSTEMAIIVENGNNILKATKF